MAEEEERKTLKTAAAAVGATPYAEDELAALKRKLEEAEAELKKWSERIEEAISKKAPDEEKKELKEERKIYLDRVKDLEGQITGKYSSVVLPSYPLSAMILDARTHRKLVKHCEAEVRNENDSSH